MLFLFAVLKVIGFESRPLMRILPPQDASDRRTKVYNFIEAIKSFRTDFTPAELTTIMSKVNPRLYSRLRENFLVINDDMEKVNKISRSAAASDGPIESATAPVTGANNVAVGQRSSTRGQKRTTESGSSVSSKSSRAR